MVLFKKVNRIVSLGGASVECETINRDPFDGIFTLLLALDDLAEDARCHFRGHLRLWFAGK